ncbi:pentatricopeptide repeat-containing protein ELI1, chloroplastic-like [Impatiens glandulifera]|uniref:pentatricopeptide repeat-containing protein ELI1, chloroplastic-like n=1 Tax=Impatiens glandulifera TaxID=253017 RepID=UPI001FB05967|nr:pentatricopeptide repeat-containing protein ELI1, chloroplastic-like [Impatiens glandulifera]
MVMKNGYLSGLYIGNALVNFYSTFGKMEDAHQVFDQMPQQDVFSWTSLLLGYTENKEMVRANEIFSKMPLRNEVSWAVMISGFVRGGLYVEALKYFQIMIYDGMVKPNEAIIVSSLSACAHLGALDQGNWINSIIDNNRISRGSNIASALINMYAKCGKVDLASRVFNQTLRRDVLIYTSMITGFSIHGLGNDALLVFNQMLAEDVKPNDVSVLAVLNGCSHSGLVNEGKSIFYIMETKWGIIPKIEHYGCYIDMLSRSGHLESAFETIKKMKMDPDKAIWRALLNGCRIHRDATKAELVINHIGRFYPCIGSSGGEVLISNLYASLGIWEKVEEVRKMMIGSSSSPGCSWIEVNGIMNEFRVGDALHPQMYEIRRELVEILKRLSEEQGYIATTTLVSFDVNEEEKEEAVAWHSEKLAIAFGLMSTPSGSSIRIVKNLRTCEDCHFVLKAISKVFSREIVVRDRTRFHTFTSGKCSCKDYW